VYTDQIHGKNTEQAALKVFEKSIGERRIP
jgi:hypothetical protein